MDNRKKNIQTLVDCINRSLDYLKKKNPSMTEDNYDEIKKLMGDVINEWYDSTPEECEDHCQELLVEAFGILWQLEAMYMVAQMRKEAYG